MTNIIAFANQKGGVGKTTTAINIGASLAAIKKRVLLVDLDQQGNAGTGLGFERASHRQSVYGVIMGTANAADNILSTAVPGLHLLPSSQALAGAEVQRQPTVGVRRQQFARAPVDAAWLQATGRLRPVSHAGHQHLAAKRLRGREPLRRQVRRVQRDAVHGARVVVRDYLLAVGQADDLHLAPAVLAPPGHLRPDQRPAPLVVRQDTHPGQGLVHVHVPALPAPCLDEAPVRDIREVHADDCPVRLDGNRKTLEGHAVMLLWLVMGGTRSRPSFILYQSEPKIQVGTRNFIFSYQLRKLLVINAYQHSSTLCITVEIRG